MKVVQRLLRGPWQRQVCRDMDCLLPGVRTPSASSFKPFVAGHQKASLASLFPLLHPCRHLEGSLARSLCCLVCQAHRGIPLLRSCSVDPRIGHLKGHPGWGPTLQFSASGVGRASLSLLQLAMLAPPPTRDSAVSPCFHGCPAFLHRHFPPQSPASRTLCLSLCSQQQTSP